MKNLSWEEIQNAINDGKKINKYGDPTEGPKEDLTLEQCEDVHREDPGLLYVESEHEPGARKINPNYKPIIVDEENYDNDPCVHQMRFQN